MENVLATKPAVFFEFQSVGIFFLVFGCGVIDPTTLGAFQLNNLAHFYPCKIGTRLRSCTIFPSGPVALPA